MILRAFTLFIAVLMLSACVTTANPIGISGGAQTDARLIGGWKVVLAADWTDDRDVYAFFLPRKEGGLQAMVVRWDPKEISNPAKNEWETYEVVTGKAGDHTIINARGLLQNGEVPKGLSSAYVPLLYRFEADGSLHLFMLSDDSNAAITDAIRSGRIAGTIGTGEAASVSGHITADPQSLDAFFTEVAPMLSTKPYATLHRLN